MTPGGRDDRGQATVEFALVLPLMIALCLAIVQVGLVAQAQLMASHGAREAARGVSLDPGADAAALVDVATGLDPDLTATTVTGGAQPGEAITVEVVTEVPVVVPMIAWLVNDVRVDASVTMIVEGDAP